MNRNSRKPDSAYRFEKGDLVHIKGQNILDPSGQRPVGIVVDVLMRSTQNSDWDKILVFINDKLDSFSPRKLIPYERATPFRNRRPISI